MQETWQETSAVIPVPVAKECTEVVRASSRAAFDACETRSTIPGSRFARSSELRGPSIQDERDGLVDR